MSKRLSAPTLSTPVPARAVHESNAKFVLGLFAVGVFVVLCGLMAGVFLFSKRTNEKTFADSTAAIPVDNSPLIDIDALRSRKPVNQVVSQTAEAPPVETTPQLPPPEDTQTAYLPPPTPPAPAPKKEWVKPTMHQGGGSVRSGDEGGSGRRSQGDGTAGGVQIAQAGMNPRNDREAFAASAGRGRKLYHAAGELPPLPGCVAKTGNVIQLATLGVVKNSAPGQFALQVVAPLQGVVYDQRRGPRACNYPLIPPRSTVICEPNIVSSGRGDQIIQAVCSRIDFPGGGTLPLDGFPLVAADGSIGVPAESDYPWGDVLKTMAIDIATAIPGALVTASAGAFGGGAGVILNVGADGFQEQGQRYKQDEVKIQKTLFIPRAAPTGLFIPADIALPDQRR